MDSFEKLGYSKWLLDEFPDHAYIADIETYELLYLNRSACKMLGRPLDQLLGCKCYEAIQGKTSPCSFCTNDRLTKDAFYEWEFYNMVFNRHLIIKNRLIDWDGRSARLELSADNLSVQYKLEKKSREQEAILKTIPGGFVRIDARNLRTVMWYGGNFLRMIGYTADQFEKELHSLCSYVHPEDIDRATEVMLRAKSTGEPTVSEGRILTRSGETKILTMTFCYVDAAESWDGLPSFYSMGIDVTEERQMRERQRLALEEAFQAARVANTAKTNFLSAMSHDIRTPMNGIIGMTAIAKAHLDSPERVRDCLDKIGTSSRHLLSLINEVLDMSKIESGKFDLALGPVNLSELLQNVTDMCRPLLLEKKQRFDVSVGRMRHENVVADGDRLRQILMNLLSNAIKYTPVGGSVSLRVNELNSPLPDQGQYEFICRDTGIGIAEECLPLVFEPFWRAEDPRISKLQGTGLGMTITENIVRMMNGTISVQSKPGSGSTFTVSVPLELLSGKEACCDELAGRPVLVVDDDSADCESAAALVDEMGMRGIRVLSGEEAVRRLAREGGQKDDFHAVLLDLEMPGMSGLQTLKAIRELPGPAVPVVIVSAYGRTDIEEDFLRAGADAFITKPLFRSKLRKVLRLFAPGNALSAAAQREEPCPGLSGKRVLLAEDNDLNREIAMELLTMQDMRVTAVENGRLALETFAASAPGEYDVILMDIQMPVMNGYDAAAAIRALKRRDAQWIPIFALTADAFSTDVAKARALGMNEHIAKPIDIDSLFKALQRWLR